MGPLPAGPALRGDLFRTLTAVRVDLVAPGPRSTTDDVGYRDLLDVERVAWMQTTNMVRMKRQLDGRGAPASG